MTKEEFEKLVADTQAILLPYKTRQHEIRMRFRDMDEKIDSLEFARLAKEFSATEPFIRLMEDMIVRIAACMPCEMIFEKTPSKP